jgi:mannose-1-phosphate guanylyltransferase
VRALILVGGEGTRLRPLTLTTPKQLLPVAEVPMISRIVGHLAEFGVREVILSMGYRPDAFLAAFPDDRCAGVALRYVVEPEPLDTGGAVRFAAEPAGVEETVLVLNGDVLTDLDIDSMLNRHAARRAEATIHLAWVDDPSAYGVVLTNADGRVETFVEKPAPGSSPGNWINAGTYVLDPAAIARIPPGRPVSLERETFPVLAEAGRLFALQSDAYWLDAGTPEKYLAANLDLLDRKYADPAPGADRGHEGLWSVGAAVVDGEVIPPALVGDAAYLARGARVHRTVVGAGARVLEGAVVQGSVLLPGSVVRSEASVEDSVIGEGAVVGEGARVVSFSVLGAGAEVPARARLSGDRLPATA